MPHWMKQQNRVQLDSGIERTNENLIRIVHSNLDNAFLLRKASRFTSPICQQDIICFAVHCTVYTHTHGLHRFSPIVDKQLVNFNFELSFVTMHQTSSSLHISPTQSVRCRFLCSEQHINVSVIPHVHSVRIRNSVQTVGRSSVLILWLILLWKFEIKTMSQLLFYVFFIICLTMAIMSIANAECVKKDPVSIQNVFLVHSCACIEVSFNDEWALNILIEIVRISTDCSAPVRPTAVVERVYQ